MEKLKDQKKKILNAIMNDVKFRDVGEKAEKGMMLSSSKSDKNKKYYPSIYLKASQLPELSNKEAGDEIEMIVKGVIRSHTVNEREGEDSKEDFCVDMKEIALSK